MRVYPARGARVLLRPGGTGVAAGRPVVRRADRPGTGPGALAAMPAGSAGIAGITWVRSASASCVP
ncbi:hypothetical protein ACU686_18235 [Yinghuangia aomiensis]